MSPGLICDCLEESNAVQVVVRFGDASSVVYVPTASDGTEGSWQQTLLCMWSSRTGWPSQYLRITSWELPFVSICTRSSIRGGKGGFGTLLKGQSRQAGAKLTTDFGACRDLQGRRLRHVNDEIKLRKWREMKRREQAGEKVPDDELWKTPSGIYNWHLMTPTWADISKKATHRIKRQFQQLDRQAQKVALKKQEQETVYQNSMIHYLEQATTATENIQKSIPDAIQQGLKAATAAAASKKRRRPDEVHLPDDVILENAEPNSLVTLSGDLVVVDTAAETASSSGMQVQSKSEFGTAVLVLDHAVTEQKGIVYFEVTLVTGGLAQIGWASLVGEAPFSPNNDLGDGVGDDVASYAVDGSRKLKFHAGKEDSYPLEWKEGDRLGCWVNSEESTIGFSLNGVDCGEAFRLNDRKMDQLSLMPAFSCNQDQVLQLHTNRADCRYLPTKDAVVVGDLFSLKPETVEETGSRTSYQGAVPARSDDSPPKSATQQVGPQVAIPERKEPTNPEPLDLTLYSSAKELEELGLDRLKSALLALQVKCGGTLTERANRLFSLKGLNRNEYPKQVRAKGFRE